MLSGLRTGQLVLCVAFSLTPATAQTRFIGTVAGGGPDDLPALTATLGYPRAVAAIPGGGYLVGTATNLYRVNSGGILEVVAGNGSRVATGNDAPALQAGLAGVDGIAIDTAGNIFISSSSENHVRRIDGATGVITAYAGPGSGGDGGPATDAYLSGPEGLAVDTTGNLYISDQFNCSVRRVDAATGKISTVMGAQYRTCTYPDDGAPAIGNGTATVDLAFDPDGNLIVGGFRRVYRLDMATGLLHVIAGDGGPGSTGDGGPARDAGVDVNRIDLDPAGNLYISSRYESRVRRVEAATGIITTLAGDGIDGYGGDGGPATLARLNRPEGLAVDGSGSLLIADYGNHLVRRIEASTGLINRVAGRTDHGDGELATRVPIAPRGIATDAAGNLYLADSLFHLVRRVDRVTGMISTVAGNGSRIGSGDGGPALAAGIEPGYLAIDTAGNLYVGDVFNKVVRRVDAATHIITRVAGNGEQGYSPDGLAATTASFEQIRGVAVDSSGNLYIGDGLAKIYEPPPHEYAQRVRKVDAVNGIMTTAAGPLSGVWSIALDPLGWLYVSATQLRPEWVDPGDPDGNRIVRIDPVTHLAQIVAGNGQFGFGGDGGPATSAMVRFPEGMVIDSSGNLFFADNGNHRIRWVEAATGIINTLAGDGIPEFRGESVPALSARLAYPYSLAFDPDGDLLFSDSGNNRVRILTIHCEKIAPRLVLSASPAILWPPNHRMVDVSVSAEPVCGSAIVTLESVTSSEPDDMPGGADGTTDDDIQGVTPGTADFTFSLRAERSGSGQGRAYQAAYRAIDSLGRSATSTVVISVPHDRGGVTDPIEITLSDSSAGTALAWRPVP